MLPKTVPQMHSYFENPTRKDITASTDNQQTAEQPDINSITAQLPNLLPDRVRWQTSSLLAPFQAAPASAEQVLLRVQCCTSAKPGGRLHLVGSAAAAVSTRQGGRTSAPADREGSTTERGRGLEGYV